MAKTQEKMPAQAAGEERLLVLLEDAQRRAGHISPELMAELAASTGLSLSQVYGVATFYSFLSTEPLGRNVIRVCKSLPCYLKSYPTIVGSLRREIGIGPGETTQDGRFSLELTNCIGACDKAPAMMINDDVHGNLTPETIPNILADYE